MVAAGAAIAGSRSWAREFEGGGLNIGPYLVADRSRGEPTERSWWVFSGGPQRGTSVVDERERETPARVNRGEEESKFVSKKIPYTIFQESLGGQQP